VLLFDIPDGHVSAFAHPTSGQQHGRRLTAAAMLTCLPTDIFILMLYRLAGSSVDFFTRTG